MKKVIATLLVLTMMFALLTGCGTQKPEESEEPITQSTVPGTEEETTPTSTEAEPKTDPVTIRLGGLTGPTSMGMVKLLDDAEKGTTSNPIDFTLAGAADELTPAFLKGELDIVAIPINLGSILYNKSEGAAKMAAVGTLGVLYIVEKGGNTVTDLESLKGKTIFATGKGATPQYALSYLLSQKGINMDTDLQIEWKSEPAEVVSTMATMDNAIAMMPQPYVTVAGTKLADLRIALDLTREWKNLDNKSQLMTAGIFVRTEFAQAHPQALEDFLTAFEASTAFVNQNVAEGAVLVDQYGFVKAAVAEKAIPYCNMVCIRGEEMKTAAQGYLQTLYDQNPTAVGGKMPADDFYWVNENK